MSAKVNRRTVLAATAATAVTAVTAAAAALPGQAQSTTALPSRSDGGSTLPEPAAPEPAQAPPEKPILKAVKFGMVGEELSVEDKFRLLQDLGFDGVELGMGDLQDPKEAVAAREKTGLPIHGVVLGSVDNIGSAVDRAVLYGATSVLVVAGRVNENMPYEENWKVTIGKIQAAVEYAHTKKIQLLLENVWNNFLWSPREMRYYLNECPGIGVYFDVGNCVRVGWPEHWIASLGQAIGKLDIKEYSREKQNNEGLWKGFDVKLGEGSIDWPAVCAALKQIGYRGWATAEVPGGDRNELADIAARMDRLLVL